VRAAVCRAFGPPETLVIENVATPRPEPGWVVVDVEACAVNFTDYLLLQNQYQVTPELPFTPGTEVAGRIAEIGDQVVGLSVGDRIFAWTGSGGLAEKVAVPADAIFGVPDEVPSAQAAAFFYAYGTAHYALMHRASLQPDEYLLVLGAAGGVGLAAVELGAAMGAKVIACASTDEKLDVCRDHGASMVINYRNEDLRLRVRDLTNGMGADVVYDAVGGPLSEPALRSTAWEGRFLVIGFASGDIPRVALNLPLLKGCSVIGVYWGSFIGREPELHKANIAELLMWWKEGRISPYVSATYPLEGAAEAIRELADRKAKGKVVVTLT
jgi:NADPH2:quinone reductase